MFEKKLKKLASELGLSTQVAFKGFVQNPYPYMAQADLFVLSSRYEGCPNAVLEAMACGTPVVAFRCKGGMDEIIDDGVNGWLAEPENVVDFATAVEKAAKT